MLLILLIVIEVLSLIFIFLYGYQVKDRSYRKKAYMLFVVSVIQMIWIIFSQ
ncbi:MAG TPA: hypothetical protein VGE59_02755 [Patescibacteria group bacterium]